MKLAHKDEFRQFLQTEQGDVLRNWLEVDVYGDSSPARQLGISDVPKNQDLRELGEHIVAAIASSNTTSLMEWLGPWALGGFSDEVLLHMIQLLISRLRTQLSSSLIGDGGANPETMAKTFSEFDSRCDQVVRGLLNYQLHRMRDALPQDDTDFLDFATVVTDTLYSTLANGMHRYVSPGIFELTGHLPEEFIADQHLWTRLVVPDDVGRTQELFEQVLAHGNNMEASYRIRHAKTGRVRHVIDRAHAVLRGDTVVRIDGILIDVTERMDLEMRLEHSEQLRSLGHLARDVAHDFNNILVSILGHTDILLSRFQEESDNFQALNLVAAAAERGSKLAERLLAFARGAASSGLKEPMDLEKVVRDAVELARPAVPPHVALELITSVERPRILGDAPRIGESILNLVINAIQACGEGDGSRIRVEIRQASLDEAGRLGLLSATSVLVTDDGPGMSDDIRARVFEPLFTTRSKKGGTGLGCAAAFGVAIDHGGLLTVESEIGEGTTFQFILPHATEDVIDRVGPATGPVSRPIAKLQPRQEAILGGVEATDTKLGEDETPRVLVVDDEPSIRVLICDLLTGAGFDVSVASGGNEALAFVAAGQIPHLVILDVMMAPVDGTRTYTQLRALVPDLPIIFCTGHTDDDRLEVPDALKHAPTLHKPFRAAALIGMARTALKKEE